jgi:hypothetical protein
MIDNICAVCFRRISAHTVREVAICQEKFGYVELERTANKLCVSCGCPSDLLDPCTNEFYCNGCLMWQTQLNDEGSQGD